MAKKKNKETNTRGYLKNAHISANGTLLIDFLLSEGYMGTKTRMDVIEEILRIVFLNTDILNDGRIFNNLGERFQVYIEKSLMDESMKEQKKK